MTKIKPASTLLNAIVKQPSTSTCPTIKIKDNQLTMAPATELATIPLVSGATIEDADSPAGKVWQSTLDTVSQQEGYQRSYWGREIENPSVLQLFVGKTSILEIPTSSSTILHKATSTDYLPIPTQTGTPLTPTKNSSHPPSTTPSANIS